MISSFTYISECTLAQKDLGCCEEKVFTSKSGQDPQWKLSDNGAGGVWKGDASSIQFDIADSLECHGTTDQRQQGSAIMEFEVEEEETIVLSMKGKAESEYETFLLYIDGVPAVTVQAQETATCQPNTCSMCDVHMAEQEFKLGPGHHVIKIDVDTMDGYYHSFAFFRIDFKMKPKDECQKCVCLKPGMKCFKANSKTIWH